ncbi:MAG: hypothetical protein JOY64_36850 [Alphaproteobacteria bacterium]|nr:hypothetical protein [Alphaproteobacteria bacterium]
MSKLAWIDFLNVHHGAHLVWGVQSEEEQDLRPVAAKLSAVIERQKTGSDYAVGVLRTTGTPKIACAFAEEEAAAAIADIVGAKPVERTEAWASERCFTLDARTLSEIDRAAGTRRRRRRMV